VVSLDSHTKTILCRHGIEEQDNDVLAFAGLPFPCDAKEAGAAIAQLRLRWRKTLR